jgi:hypothetical protein
MLGYYDRQKLRENLNFSEIRLPHTTSNFSGICGIHLFVEFDLNVALIQFLIIDFYLNCIDIFINIKNYASKMFPVLETSYYALHPIIAEPRPTKKQPKSRFSKVACQRNLFIISRKLLKM